MCHANLLAQNIESKTPKDRKIYVGNGKIAQRSCSSGKEKRLEINCSNEILAGRRRTL